MPVVLQITEVDSYVVGNNFYQTDVTVANTGGPSDANLDDGAELYHAADCQLRGTDTGFGAFEPNQASAITAACTPNVLGTPPSALEEFVPITYRRQPGSRRPSRGSGRTLDGSVFTTTAMTAGPL